MKLHGKSQFHSTIWWLKLSGMTFLPGTTSHNTNNHSTKATYSNYPSKREFKAKGQQFSMPYFCTLHASCFLCTLGQRSFFPVLCVLS